MKRTVVISCILSLLVGIFAGGLLPMPWDEAGAPAAGTIVQPPTSSSSENQGTLPSDAVPAALDPKDNFTLLGTASYVAKALRDMDYPALAAVVHPEQGVTFTSYSTVNREADLTLTRQQVAELEEDKNVYIWGFADGSGEPIQMNAAQYLKEYVFDVDYTRAPQIGLDRVLLNGNALENVSEAYPGCRFVEFSFPGQGGMDWSSLKLVFEPGETSWLLVGIIHGEWTI